MKNKKYSLTSKIPIWQNIIQCITNNLRERKMFYCNIPSSSFLLASIISICKLWMVRILLIHQCFVSKFGITSSIYLQLHSIRLSAKISFDMFFFTSLLLSFVMWKCVSIVIIKFPFIKFHALIHFLIYFGIFSTFISSCGRWFIVCSNCSCGLVGLLKFLKVILDKHSFKLHN